MPDSTLPARRDTHYTQAVTAPAANAIDWQPFLARPPLPAASTQALAALCDRCILVTGAGGSIGSALSLRLAALRPRRLFLLDASEQALYRLQIALEEAGLAGCARLVLGDCKQASLLEEILEPRQLIFHAAAYKHVPILERHPLEAIANNALATLTLAEAAQRAGGGRIVLLSTDKAAAPVSILGATKRIAERIVLAHSGIALRLGNVLGSEGSVSETFARQLSAGSPITVTTVEAERYFLTCAEAVELLLTCAIPAPSGSLLAPELPHRHRIVDLARFLSIALSPAQQPAFVFTGNRPGDKLREVFWSGDELASQSGMDGLLRIAEESVTRLPPDSAWKAMQDAVLARDLARAMDSAMQLVPGYSPSATILAQLTPAEVRS